MNLCTESPHLLSHSNTTIASKVVIALPPKNSSKQCNRQHYTYLVGITWFEAREKRPAAFYEKTASP